MTIVNRTIFNQPKAGTADFDKPIMFSYLVFAVVILGLIYATSGTWGTYDGEIAAMAVFP